jgi:hypothetical protein
MLGSTANTNTLERAGVEEMCLSVVGTGQQEARPS